MYGRPMEYYHQLQDFDFAGEWQELKVPVRIRWGKDDWIISEPDNDMIFETHTTNGDTDVELVKPEDLDHWATIHPTAINSFIGKLGKWKKHISGQIIDWINELKI